MNNFQSSKNKFKWAAIVWHAHERFYKKNLSN